ncbi:MAG: lipocalin family protein [Asticcacaulis sp.]
MKTKRLVFPLLLTAGAVLFLAACATFGGRSGNRSVPQPAQPIDLAKYVGLWYEIGRYENRFEKDCEAVTAEYRSLPDGQIEVINSCRKDSVDGRKKVAKGKAKVMPGSDNAKLKVSFFGPFYGNYWVMDRAQDYSWAIVGEPSGRYLWLLSRTAQPDDLTRATMETRTREMGYDWSMVRMTKH